MDKIEQQLETISNSIDSVDDSISEFNENYSNDGGSLNVIGFIIVILLFCINNNIKKLTQAIRGKRLMN
ncbi:hypothetical protein [Terrisporobacter sp.]